MACSGTVFYSTWILDFGIGKICKHHFPSSSNSKKIFLPNVPTLCAVVLGDLVTSLYFVQRHCWETLISLDLFPWQFHTGPVHIFPFVLIPRISPQTSLKGWGAEVKWEERCGKGEVSLNSGYLLAAKQSKLRVTGNHSILWWLFDSPRAILHHSSYYMDFPYTKARWCCGLFCSL